MLIMNVEKLNINLFNELLELLMLSKEEVYKNKDNQILYNNVNINNIDYNFFKTLEDNNMLNISTLRLDNKLIGHCTFTLSFHKQAKNILTATCQNIHVKKEYRGKTSLKFIKYNEEVLKKRGVKLIYFGVNPKNNTQKIFEHLGYSIDEIVLSKQL